MMSLTALSVCRGTPRLKFHGMKISARLFSLSPHLVLVYRGTYFLQMFVFFLGPSSRKKHNVQTSRNGFPFSYWLERGCRHLMKISLHLLGFALQNARSQLVVYKKRNSNVVKSEID